MVFDSAQKRRSATAEFGRRETCQPLSSDPVRIGPIAIDASGTLVRPEAFAEDAGSGENYIENLCQHSGHKEEFGTDTRFVMIAREICG